MEGGKYDGKRENGVMDGQTFSITVLSKTKIALMLCLSKWKRNMKYVFLRTCLPDKTLAGGFPREILLWAEGNVFLL